MMFVLLWLKKERLFYAHFLFRKLISVFFYTQFWKLVPEMIQFKIFYFTETYVGTYETSEASVPLELVVFMEKNQKKKH